MEVPAAPQRSDGRLDAEALSADHFDSDGAVGAFWVCCGDFAGAEFLVRWLDLLRRCQIRKQKTTGKTSDHFKFGGKVDPELKSTGIGVARCVYGHFGVYDCLTMLVVCKQKRHDC